MVGTTLALGAALVIGTAAWLRDTAAPAHANPRIAILPFDNLSPDPGLAYFTDGLHEEILTTLAGNASELEVVSRTTMMLYRNSTKSLTEIAAELGASHVLSATVRREGDAVRFSFHLDEARSDRALLTETYDRTLSSALTLQAEVAQQVARRLSARLFGVAQVAAAPTTDPRAWDLYLKARLARQSLSGAASIEDWLGVQRLLDEALMLDPRFTRAYVARSELHFQIARLGYDASQARRDLAQSDAEEARRLAPDDPATLAAQALLASTPAEAIALFEAAERAGLSDPDLLFAKAGALTSVGRAREGTELVSRLMALDPANEQLATLLFIRFIRQREPERALQTLASIEARTSRSFGPQRAMVRFLFTGNAEVLEPWSGAEFFRQQAGQQDPRNALRDNVERLVSRERFAEARDLLDSVQFDTTRNVFVIAFMVVGTGDTPNADYRGWLSLLLGDSAGAAQDGARVLAFLARTPETPSNEWYRLSLRADANVFMGNRPAAAADARAMLALTEGALNGEDLRSASRFLAARIFAWAGEGDSAVDLLEGLSVEEPGLPPATIARLAWFTVPLRDHPRFRSLAARLEDRMAAYEVELPSVTR